MLNPRQSAVAFFFLIVIPAKAGAHNSEGTMDSRPPRDGAGAPDVWRARFRGNDDRNTTRADAVPSQDSLTLAFPGVQGPIPYETFGHFDELGTPRYRYVITDRPGLARAAGEGIYPNTDIFKDPAYQNRLK